MFGKILTSLLKLVMTGRKSSILDVWQGFEFAFVTIDCSSKSVDIFRDVWTKTNIVYVLLFNIFAE